MASLCFICSHIVNETNSFSRVTKTLCASQAIAFRSSVLNLSAQVVVLTANCFSIALPSNDSATLREIASRLNRVRDELWPVPQGSPPGCRVLDPKNGISFFCETSIEFAGDISPAAASVWHNYLL